MITFRITADIKEDRRVVLTLPSDVPTGQAELVVSVEQLVSAIERPTTTLPDWTEAKAENDGREQTQHLLRGSVVRYERPTEPVAEGEWEALR
jgi:hypothetical protein